MRLLLRLFCTCALLVFLMTGCGGGGAGAEAPSVVQGRIVEIEYDAGLTRSFTLRTAAGESYELSISDDVNYGFDLAHLEQHRVGGQPVRCRIVERGDRLLAMSIEDA
jgi:hypothetical protein